MPDRTFEVVEVDHQDNSYLLRDLAFAQTTEVQHVSGTLFRVAGKSPDVWARCSLPLEVGQRCIGSFSFDPRESLRRGVMPNFLLQEGRGDG